MENYIYNTIKESQYLLVFITRMIGDNNGTEPYMSNAEILDNVRIGSPKIFTNHFCRTFVWYYNLYISKDTRHNFRDIRELKKEVKRLSDCS